MSKASFDVIIVGDFRYPGGTSSAVAAEVRALRQSNRRVGLYQMNSPTLRAPRGWNERILTLADNGDAVVLPPGAAATCDIMLAHSPWLFIQPQPEQRQIEAKLRLLVAHHTPTDAKGRLNYDPALVDRHAACVFGQPLIWAPVSPVCRDSFDVAGMVQPRLREDWTNVIFAEDWGHPRAGLLGPRPVLGRHSRPHLQKWPASRREVLASYPSEMEVRLLGVNDQVRAFLDPLPPNWMTWEFNEIPIKDFLAGIDVFVYFHHPELTESFGLTVAEAAAAGCVVVTHPYLERTFGTGALYCQPEEAPILILAVTRDPQRFAERSAQGWKAIADRFGPEAYLRRFNRLLAASRTPSLLDEVVVRPERKAQAQLRSLWKQTIYWWRNGFSLKGQALLQRKVIKRPSRKIMKALRWLS